VIMQSSQSGSIRIVLLLLQFVAVLLAEAFFANTDSHADERRCFDDCLDPAVCCAPPPGEFRLNLFWIHERFFVSAFAFCITLPVKNIIPLIFDSAERFSSATLKDKAKSQHDLHALDSNKFQAKLLRALPFTSLLYFFQPPKISRSNLLQLNSKPVKPSKPSKPLKSDTQPCCKPTHRHNSTVWVEVGTDPAPAPNARRTIREAEWAAWEHDEDIQVLKLMLRVIGWLATLCFFSYYGYLVLVFGATLPHHTKVVWLLDALAALVISNFFLPIVISALKLVLSCVVARVLIVINRATARRRRRLRSAAAAVTASAAAFGQKRKITVKEPRKENRKYFAKVGGWKVAPAPQTECASERQQTDYVHTLR